MVSTGARGLDRDLRDPAPLSACPLSLPLPLASCPRAGMVGNPHLCLGSMFSCLGPLPRTGALWGIRFSLFHLNLFLLIVLPRPALSPELPALHERLAQEAAEEENPLQFLSNRPGEQEGGESGGRLETSHLGDHGSGGVYTDL